MKDIYFDKNGKILREGVYEHQSKTNPYLIYFTGKYNSPYISNF